MLDSVFRHEFKQSGGVHLTENHILFRKPLELYDVKNDISVFFKTLDEAYQFKIGDKTIKDIITEATIDIFKVRCDGGSGAGSPSQSFKFGHAGGGSGAGVGEGDLPARMNTRIKTKTVDEAIKQFRNTHQNDDRESLIQVDVDGFVQQYNHGSAHSVAFTPKNNGLVIHNHPSNSHFSDTDLLNLSTTNTRGVVATTKSGYYMVTKGTHFKTNEFGKAVKKANMRGTDYNDAVDKWLKKNQKRYGYVYKNVKDSKTKTPAPKIDFDSRGQGVLF